MKKLIDIPDKILKDLKKLAIDADKDLKNFIQDHLISLVHANKTPQGKNMEEYSYWQISFIDSDGNERWDIARTPPDWEEPQVRDRIPVGGSLDEVCEVIHLFKTTNFDYSWDFCDF